MEGEIPGVTSKVYKPYEMVKKGRKWITPIYDPEDPVLKRFREAREKYTLRS